MEFGEIPTDTAEGAILAHSHRLESRVLKKGRVLSRDDVRDLLGAGHKSVVCARLGENDMAEDDAANLLAEAVSGSNLTRSEAFTGRVNLYAKEAGVVVYEPDRLDGFNLVDEAVTLGVVPAYQAVAAGQMVATLKIIPFGVPRSVVQIARSLAERAERLVRVAPYRPATVGLIQTTSRDEGQRARRHRPGYEGSAHGPSGTLVEEVRVPHTEAATARAIERLLVKAVDLILIAGASAVVDRRDVIPASIERAGGAVDALRNAGGPRQSDAHRQDRLRFRLRHARLRSVPQAQRLRLGSPTRLLRIADHTNRHHADGRRWPSERYPNPPPAPRKAVRTRVKRRARILWNKPTHAPRIAAIVLAAGQSRRMGRSNKLLAEIDGMSMVRRTVRNIGASSVVDTVVVTGHERERVLESLTGLGIRDVHNPDYDAGLSTSLASGLSVLGEDIDGVIVCLGDMPRVTSTIVDKLIAAYDPVEGRAICVPTQNSKRGNPVLWDRRFFTEMTQVSGDVGARHLIGTHADLVAEVEMGDEAVLIDIDTPDALAKFGGRAADRDPSGEA